MARPSGIGHLNGSDALNPAAPTGAWSGRLIAALVAAFAIGIVLRLLLLPTPGFRGDLDQFVGWVHLIATNGLGTLYDPNPYGPVTFGPVMALIWGVIGVVQPAFQTAVDASDPSIRIAMKLPAALADLGLAGLTVFALRARPGWAVVGGAAVLLHPAVLDVGAWWGQYDSVYVLAGLAAVVLAINGRNGPAAALIVIAILTKPQAIAFIIPFAAWFWATGGWRETTPNRRRSARSRPSRCGCRSSPPADRRTTWPTSPSTRTTSSPSCRFGPGTPGGYPGSGGRRRLHRGRRRVPRAAHASARGYAVTALLQVVIAISILRDPRPRTLVLGLAASPSSSSSRS